MINPKTAKELFDYVRSADTKNTLPLKSILADYDIEKYPINELLDILNTDLENILLIDARSEKEFEETSVPFSVNFPVLTNDERHNTGLIYKKYSQTSALWLAMEYANPKADDLKIFLEEHKAKGKNIFVYCWRGGGRSGYLAKMISDLGYKPSTIIGGYKSYRRTVNEFFSLNPFPHELLELSGLTGCGKSELLRAVYNDLPVIDLEEAARHYSSLLGHLPYEIRNQSPVANQSAFENNLYSQVFFNSKKFNNFKPDHLTQQTQPAQLTYLIESESKKVGSLETPKYLYEKLISAPSVKIVSTMECRVKRIVKDYFGDDLRGIEPMKSTFLDKGYFFKQQLSSTVFNELIEMLDAGRVEEFSEIMIKDYYDKKYKDKGKKALAEISTDDIQSAKKDLIEIYKNFSSN